MRKLLLLLVVLSSLVLPTQAQWATNAYIPGTNGTWLTIDPWPCTNVFWTPSGTTTDVHNLWLSNLWEAAEERVRFFYDYNIYSGDGYYGGPAEASYIYDAGGRIYLTNTWTNVYFNIITNDPYSVTNSFTNMYGSPFFAQRESLVKLKQIMLTVIGTPFEYYKEAPWYTYTNEYGELGVTDFGGNVYGGHQNDYAMWLDPSVASDANSFNSFLDSRAMSSMQFIDDTNVSRYVYLQPSIGTMGDWAIFDGGYSNYVTPDLKGYLSTLDIPTNYFEYTPYWCLNSYPYTTNQPGGAGMTNQYTTSNYTWAAYGYWPMYQILNSMKAVGFSGYCLHGSITGRNGQGISGCIYAMTNTGPNWRDDYTTGTNVPTTLYGEPDELWYFARPGRNLYGYETVMASYAAYYSDIFQSTSYINTAWAFYRRPWISEQYTNAFGDAELPSRPLTDGEWANGYTQWVWTAANSNAVPIGTPTTNWSVDGAAYVWYDILDPYEMTEVDDVYQSNTIPLEAYDGPPQGRFSLVGTFSLSEGEQYVHFGSAASGTYFANYIYSVPFQREELYYYPPYCVLWPSNSFKYVPE